MPSTDSRIDDYIAGAGEFARPILSRVRKLIHEVCPSVTETMKWGSPFYEHHGVLVGTPAFKKHCALIFWKDKLIFKDVPTENNPSKRLRKLTSIEELPDDTTLIRYIEKSIELNEAGVKEPVRSKPNSKKRLVVPKYLQDALNKSKRTLAAFENLSPSCKREYVEWLVDAKREETRAKRLATAVKWIAEGKNRNWKYEKH